eukprot:PhF_6_TR20854/c0_g1_i1/m.30058
MSKSAQQRSPTVYSTVITQNRILQDKADFIARHGTTTTTPRRQFSSKGVVGPSKQNTESAPQGTGSGSEYARQVLSAMRNGGHLPSSASQSMLSQSPSQSNQSLVMMSSVSIGGGGVSPRRYSPSPDISTTPLSRSFTAAAGTGALTATIAVNTIPPLPMVHESIMCAMDPPIDRRAEFLEKELNARIAVKGIESMERVELWEKWSKSLLHVSLKVIERLEGSCKASMVCWASAESNADEYSRTAEILRVENQSKDYEILKLEGEITTLMRSRSRPDSPTQKVSFFPPTQQPGGIGVSPARSPYSTSAPHLKSASEREMAISQIVKNRPNPIAISCGGSGELGSRGKAT